MNLTEALKNLPFICEMTEKQVEAVLVLEKLGEKVLEIQRVSEALQFIEELECWALLTPTRKAEIFIERLIKESE